MTDINEIMELVEKGDESESHRFFISFKEIKNQIRV